GSDGPAAGTPPPVRSRTDPDHAEKPVEEPPPARGEADDGRRPLRGRARGAAAVPRARGAPRAPRLPRPRVLRPSAPGPARSDLHLLQVPHDGAGRRIAARRAPRAGRAEARGMGTVS